MKFAVSALALAGLLGFSANAMAEHSMHQVYQHHYKRMHKDAHHGHRQACIGQASGTAHRSCGTHTGGPVGSLH